MPPPFIDEALPEMVELEMVRVPPSLEMPPLLPFDVPEAKAVLLEMMELETVRNPRLKMPPPSKLEALLLEIVELETVAVPPL